MKYIIISLIAILVILYFLAVYVSRLEPVIPYLLSDDINHSKENSVFINEYICINQPDIPFEIKDIWLEKSCSYINNKLDTVYESREQLIINIERTDKTIGDFLNMSICNTDEEYSWGFVQVGKKYSCKIYTDQGMFNSKGDTLKLLFGDRKCQKIKYELTLLKTERL